MTVFPLALQGATVVHFAAMATDMATLRLLMERGIRLDVRDHKGNSPMHEAASRGRLDSVKLLVEEAGVNPKQRDAEGLSPLDLAAYNGHLDRPVPGRGAGDGPDRGRCGGRPQRS